ncbi:hypothetical protein Fmac_008095 [Flemingia macrophylla]|uniref:Uncharacterized protein n=1 Tax=Flemingia macrophylla TaxID=520843 RepID=A0ABD1MWE7_9FABA
MNNEKDLSSFVVLTMALIPCSLLVVFFTATAIYQHPFYLYLIHKWKPKQKPKPMDIL